MKVSVKTVDSLLKQAKFRQSFEDAPKGGTYRDLSTIVIIPIKGVTETKANLICKKCKHKNEYLSTTIHGFHPIFVEAWKRLVKPMNVPVLEMVVQGMEVGAAYSTAIENILANPALNKFKYILTVEDDNIIPFIPGTQGPLMALYEGIEKGYDVVGGLYWTKGNPSMPLLYGEPGQGRDEKSGMFKVRFPCKPGHKHKKGDACWKDGSLVECNGMGMGFTLFKTEIFKDSRIEKPWFKTVGDHGTTETPGMRQYTQDLWFFEKIRKLGYRVAVDTKIKVGHLDVKSGIIY